LKLEVFKLHVFGSSSSSRECGSSSNGISCRRQMHDGNECACIAGYSLVFTLHIVCMDCWQLVSSGAARVFLT
jgi:hypothetical protein